MRFALLGAGLFTLAACASPDPTFYTLEPIPGATLQTPPAAIEIRRPGLAGYLDRSDVVLAQSDYRLSLTSQRRWAEPLGDMIGRVLTQDLAQRLPDASVYGQSGAITADPALRVEVDIQAFNADASGQVVLNAEVAIERGITHKPLATQAIHLTEAPQGPGATGLAAALSHLLARLSDRLAGTIASAPAR